MAGNAIEPGRSVTSKVAAILLTFGDGAEHSLTEIARLTCMPLSTTHRLVTELAGWGLLERTAESQFRVGGSIRAIGSRVSYSPRIIELARRVLDDLAATVRTSARLGVLAGMQVAYIERRCDHRPVTTFAHAPRLPAHATALGKALLAFSPAELLNCLITEGLTCYTARTLTDPEELRRSLAVTRLTRVAVSRCEFEQSVSAVAVPVFGAGGTAAAALELTVMDLRADQRLAQSVLTVAARGLSRELSTGTNTTCFAVSTEQLTDVRSRVMRPEQALAVRAKGADLPYAENFSIAVGQR
jgi:DNA-binding IclR family transcriptional regulator